MQGHTASTLCILMERLCKQALVAWTTVRIREVHQTPILNSAYIQTLLVAIASLTLLIRRVREASRVP